MRALLLTLPLLSGPALAETFTVSSKATAATIYASGALVTHDLALRIPAGRHQIVLPDLPPDLSIDTLRVSAPGLKLGAVRYRRDLTPPRPASNDPRIMAAKAQIEEIEAQIEAVKDDAARQRLEVDAAAAQIDFFAGLGSAESLPSDPAELRALAALIGQETLRAKQAGFHAELAVRTTLRALEALEKDLKDAEQNLAALAPEAQDRPLLVLDVTAASDAEQTPLAVTFYANASWQPAYDLRLSLGEQPELVIDRSARVYQYSGENWDDVALTLSTQAIDRALDPRQLFPDLRRIYDKDELFRPALRSTVLSDAPMSEPLIVEEAAAMVEFSQGLAVNYTWNTPVAVASGADEVRLPFDTVALEAELVARAVPLTGSTAFLVAKITNTTDAPLLASAEALRFVGGGFVGTGPLDTIQPGAEAEIGFGSLDGLQLTRRIVTRGEADRGILSKTNEITEEIEITLKNLTPRAWDVELRDRVPYSEQEDLEITYRATPSADITAVDGKRGVLQWAFEMAPGDEKRVQTSYEITWPDGQRLQ